MIVKGGSPSACARALGTIAVKPVLASVEPFAAANSSKVRTTCAVASAPPALPGTVPSPTSETIRFPGVKPRMALCKVGVELADAEAPCDSEAVGVGLELGESDTVGVPDGVCVCDAVTLGLVLDETLAVEVVDGEVLIVGVSDTVELADAEAPCDSEAVGEELGVDVADQEAWADWDGVGGGVELGVCVDDVVTVGVELADAVAP